MSAPNDILVSILDLIRVPTSNTGFTSRINSLYDREMDELIRESDFIVERESISAVADQSLYQTSTRAARMVAVFHNKLSLMRSSSRSLDLNSTWQSDGGGTPEEWSQDKLPPGLDGIATINPEHFAVHPAPLVSATGDSGLTILEVARPSDDVLVPLYLRPWIIFKTTAAFWGGDTDDRDAAGEEFWNLVADLWLGVVKDRVPI
mgnify:FL=1